MNGVVVGQEYGQPCNRHPARRQGVVHVEASAGICTGIQLRTVTGQDGEGGGEYDGECLFDDNHDDNEYYDNDESNGVEDRKGSCRGADSGGESNYDGCNVIYGPSFSGVEHRTLIVSPHATAAVINDNDNNNHRCGGGVSCPPPPVHPILPDTTRHC